MKNSFHGTYLHKISNLFSRRRRRSLVTFGAFQLLAPWASAQAAPAPDPKVMGIPQPDAKAIVDKPKGPGDAPAFDRPSDATNITLSSGGLLSSGNSRLVALTANGSFEVRRAENGIGGALLGNYGRSAAPDQALQTTTENLQGRIRYDRYVSDRMSLFFITTGRHDRFQGLDLRMNFDPGVKYLFVKEPAYAAWVEAGYDFQHDIRRNESRRQFDPAKNLVVDGNGQAILLDKTLTDHSTRLYAGFRYAFNKEVTLTTGVEYLQSVVDTERYRFNYDGLFAAKVSGGLALGLGLSARYDHKPLAGKKDLDTVTTVSLIYSFSDVPTPPAANPCPPPPPPPPVPPCPTTTPVSAPRDFDPPAPVPSTPVPLPVSTPTPVTN